MAHDREFQRKRKDTRMPVRDSHGEDQPASRQTEQDFDLRRPRDTPSSVNGKTHRQDIPVQTELLWSSIFVTLMANKIGGLQFGIYRNCQISSRVFHTAVAALPLTKANRSDFE